MNRTLQNQYLSIKAMHTPPLLTSSSSYTLKRKPALYLLQNNQTLVSCTVAQSLLYLARAFTFLLNKTLHWFVIRAQLFNSFQQGYRNLGIPGHDNRDSYHIAPSLFIEGFSQTPVSSSFVSFLNPSELHLEGQRSTQNRPIISTMYRLCLQTKSKCALTIWNVKCSSLSPIN